MRKPIPPFLLLLLSVLCAFPVMAAMPDHPTPEQIAHDEEIGRWVQKAETLLEQNDLRGARQAAAEALRIADSQHPVSIERIWLPDELAPIYMRSGQYERAAALFGPHPDLGRNLSINEALAFVKTHRLADARKCYRDSVLLYYHRDFKPYLPGSSNAKQVEATLFLWRGITDVDQNHPTNAIWALNQAVQLVPKNPLALWYYAEALANAGRVPEARHFFQAAIKLDHGLVARRAREGMARLERAH